MYNPCMDTGDGSTTNGNGHHVPDPISTQSNTASPKGLPVESSKADGSTGSPAEPLVVVDKDPPARAKLTPNQFAFLQALAAEAGNVSAASRRCEQSRANHYGWMNETDEHGSPTSTALAYRELVNAIENEACDEVDAEIRRRGIKGVQEPVYYQGEICGYVQKFSDLLLIFRAKALMPEKYRERHEVTGAGGAPLHPSKVEHTHKIDLSLFTDNELEDYTRLVSTLASRGGAGTLPGQN